MKRIAVYSGSFNPLHIGHLAILKYLTDNGRFDCVHLIVSPKNPLKEGISSLSGRDRYDAALEAVKRRFHNDPGRIIVDDIELKMPEPHYTIRTLDALRQREQSDDITLVIGADNLSDIRRWKDYDRILREYGVAVYPRSGYDLDAVISDLMAEDGSYKIDIINAEMVDISSTIIRDAISKGQDMSQWLM